jgi:hypothetical protein
LYDYIGFTINMVGILQLISYSWIHFSYRDNVRSNDIKTGDNETAHNNYFALKHFFVISLI